MEKIKYRVRPVARYVVTRYHEADGGSGVEGKGEFDNWETAYAVGYALAKEEHERLGWPLCDERIIYPAGRFERAVEESIYASSANTVTKVTVVPEKEICFTAKNGAP